ncbi:MAG: helix-turn-helix transcriptional regulator [Isosphaeraceae bacterium]|nr:helix-turn-helix transcriptional regulator [Isosphaeraceae bacterium]
MGETTDRTDRERRRLTPGNVPAELRESYERRRVERQATEYQEALRRDIEAIRAEFPPKPAPAEQPELADVLARLRDERTRLGLSMAEVQQRTGIDAATITRLESGRIPNPSLGLLETYARALGKRFVWALQEAL